MLDAERNYGTQINIFGDILAVGIPFSENVESDIIELNNLYCPALSAPLLKPTPTATSTPTPTPTPTVTPTLTPPPTLTPTTTPTPTTKGIVTFEVLDQIVKFDSNDSLFPFN